MFRKYSKQWSIYGKDMGNGKKNFVYIKITSIYKRMAKYSKKILFYTKPYFESFISRLNVVQKVSLVSSAFLLLLALLITVFFPRKAEIQLGQSLSGVGGVYIPSQELAKDATQNENNETESIDDETEKLKQSLLSEDVNLENSATDNKDSATLQKYLYTVKNGDTLSEIASEYKVSVESIAGSSGIRMIDNLRVGQELQIPSMNGFFYVLKSGDRLAKVLDSYKVDLNEFLGANQSVSLDLSEEGDEVFLPGAKPKDIIRGWLIPVSSRLVTSGYGWRTYPRKSFHKGLDFRAAYVPVRASRGGTVTYAGSLGGYGYVVIIKHSGGYRSLYAHLSKIYVRSKMRVSQGTVIGRSGNSGFSFGPHLHFEVSYKGRTINPRSLFTGLRYK